MDFEPVDDLEQAYLRALKATEAIEEDLARTLPPEVGLEDSAESPLEASDEDERPVEQTDPQQNGPDIAAAVEAADPHAAAASDPSATDPFGRASGEEFEPASEPVDPSQSQDDGANAEVAEVHAEVPSRVTPKQIIEAALFVGGTSLTAKKLCAMLRGEYDLDFIEQTIDELNLQYTDEARPYEIRLGEGGYRLVLRPEFERIRNRVYGIVPKEVKLSQEVLEVLALVAYRQPVSKEDIEGFGRLNPGGPLRQLLRRELISIERGSGGRKDIRYHTTSRFLSLFGLSNLEELPQADELSFK